MPDSGILKQFPFFASLSDGQLARVLDHARRLTFSSGDVVFRAGDLSGAMYLVLEGKVRVYRLDVDTGDEIELGVIGAGQTFGELAMLSGEPRMATVTVLESGEFLEITREILLETIADASPESILNIFAVLSNQIRATNEHEFHEILGKRTLAAEMEIERQRSLTQMVAGVAHELNTPLGIINTAVGIIERKLGTGQLTEERKGDLTEALRLMNNNIQRAHRLVQEFKKVSISQLSDIKEEFDIVEAVAETIGLVRVSLKRRDVTIQLHYQLDEQARRWSGYRGYLSQIFINLITNAERYAYPPGTSGVVDVTIELDGNDNYRITVRDYGKGIPEKNLSQVFTPFFTTGRSMGGTGLGLAIVHNIITNAFKGSVKVESDVGKGTVFFVTLPRIIPE